MWRVCKYMNCNNAQHCTTPLSFFKLPNDERKSVWIKHSGNEILKNSNSKVVLFCENHFWDNSIIVTGLRKILKKNALPKPYESICSCTAYQIDESCRELLENILETKNQNVKCMVANQPSTSSSASPPLTGSVKTYEPSEYFVKVEELDIDEKSIQLFETSDIPCEEQQSSVNSKELSQSILTASNSKSVKRTKYRNLEDEIDEILKEKAEDVVVFIKSQLFHKKGSAWSNEERDMSLKFYYKSPLLYKHLLDTGFELPSIKTIQRWLN